MLEKSPMIAGVDPVMGPMNWYCIHTKPKKEKLVEHYLQNELGLETYYPRLKRKKTIRRIRHEVLEPLFPRYLFCKLNLTESYRAVTYGRDIIGVVSTGDHPTEVSDQTIEHIRDWAGSEGDIITLEPNPIKAGDRIRITEGPMQGLEAVFMRETSQEERVSILLDLMESRAKVEIDRNQIEPMNN